jgi:ATP-binding cassette subfamily B protein
MIDAIRGYWRRMRTVARVSYETDRRLTVTTSAFSVLTLLFGSVVGAFLLKVITNAVVRHQWPTATVAAALLAAHQGASFVLARLFSRSYTLLQERNREHYDREILRLTATIPGIEHYENPQYLNELEQLRAQPQALAQMLAVTVQALGLVAQTSVVILLVGLIDLRLAAVPLLTIPAVIALRRGQTITNRAWEELAEPNRHANFLFGLLTNTDFAKEVRMERLEDELVDRHDRAWREIDRRNARAERRAIGLSIGGWTVFAAAFLVMILVTVSRAARGEASIGDVVLTVALATQLSRQLVTVLEVVNRIGRNAKAVERFLWLADYAHERTPSADNAMVVPAKLESGIDVAGLRFTYPGTDVEVIKGIDLRLPAGAVIAVLGENGAGKTTLVKLLTGMYLPTTGTITIDGTTLDHFAIDEWRANMSAAFQDFTRFELTARESVGIGNLPYLQDDEMVAIALRRAGADDVIAQLPAGLDSHLGGSFDDGAELSGGQWQKIALGRAMMRSTPALLILDEPTASLDPLAERSLFDRYIAWARTVGREEGTITLLISHRYSTTRAADLIVMLEDGRIAEIGTHDELVGQDGAYAELYELQARAYR